MIIQRTWGMKTFCWFLPTKPCEIVPSTMTWCRNSQRPIVFYLSMLVLPDLMAVLLFPKYIYSLPICNAFVPNIVVIYSPLNFVEKIYYYDLKTGYVFEASLNFALRVFPSNATSY